MAIYPLTNEQTNKRRPRGSIRGPKDTWLWLRKPEFQNGTLASGSMQSMHQELRHPCSILGHTQDVLWAAFFGASTPRSPSVVGCPVTSNQPPALSCHRKGTRHVPALRTGDPGTSTWSAEKLRHVSGKGGVVLHGGPCLWLDTLGLTRKQRDRKLLSSFWDSSG